MGDTNYTLALGATIALVFVLNLVVVVVLRRRGISSPASCGRCAHWDHAEGQATMQQYPTFLLAARHLKPAQMGRTIQYEKLPCPEPGCTPEAPNLECEKCQGNGTIQKRIGLEPTNIAAKTRWEDFGACTHPDDPALRHCDDVCEHFERTRAGLVQLRSAR